MKEFVIPGEPGFKRRGRAFVHDKLRVVKVAQPKENASYEAKVATFAQMAGFSPQEGPMALEVAAFYAPPKSLCKKRTPVRRGTPKGTKPDWDNIGKIVSDALNGVAWIDDSQVARATVTKCYAAQGEAGYVLVRVTPLGVS